MNEVIDRHPSAPGHNRLCPKQNLLFVAALALTLIGCFTFWLSVQPIAPPTYPTDKILSPAMFLEIDRVQAENQIRRLLSPSVLIATVWLTCVTVFPVNGLLTLVWIRRRQWLLRIMAVATTVLALFGSHRLIEAILVRRKALADIVVRQAEMRQNLPKAKSIVYHLNNEETEAYQKFAALERNLNETDVIDQLTLRTLLDLKSRQQRLQETIAAGKASMALLQDIKGRRIAAFRQAGVNPDGSGSQAGYECAVERHLHDDVERDLAKLNEPEQPMNVRIEMYEIKLKMLNITEQVWKNRSIDRRTHKVFIDGAPEAFRQYKKLLEELEAYDRDDETPESSQ